ncbi:hypothetical protein [Variovorax sp. dw_954]|uniref:hypothetical protein n=1 Tax=Variovorax sp. dw_954 TaxID=2720078 RepID=UPI001BD51765|nr:hypothetical protein [Variovorax sp. dw_954]
MNGRKVAVYYAWDRSMEVSAPLAVLENRFPALFESRRMLYPRFSELSDPERFNQGIEGFLDQILKKNFVEFAEFASRETGHRTLEIERGGHDDRHTPLGNEFLRSIDTLIVISFDSIRTAQQASVEEIAGVAEFLERTDNLVFVCPHHSIGHADEASEAALRDLQLQEFLHHGDKTIPPQQRFGGFARSLLSGLGVPVENLFGLRPAAQADGSPAPIKIERDLDHLGILEGVTTFNAHPHLPHLRRVGDGGGKLDVLARQRIDTAAPPHSFVQGGRTDFDALLQARPGVFAGSLLVGDATLWSSTAGGVDNLRRLWKNVVGRPSRPVIGFS